jgi:hypothetical protein
MSPLALLRDGETAEIVGYIRKENKVGERLDLWHASVAAELEVIKNLKLLANIGVERSPEKGSDNHPSFALPAFPTTCPSGSPSTEASSSA